MPLDDRERLSADSHYPDDPIRDVKRPDALHGVPVDVQNKGRHVGHDEMQVRRARKARPREHGKRPYGARIPSRSREDRNAREDAHDGTRCNAHVRCLHHNVRRRSSRRPILAAFSTTSLSPMGSDPSSSGEEGSSGTSVGGEGAIDECSWVALTDREVLSRFGAPLAGRISSKAW